MKENAVRAISRPRGKTEYYGIHVFIDCSNIIIGCIDLLKAKRANSETGARPFTRQPPISFLSLALILERGRSAARRVLVGSQISLNGHNLRKVSNFHFVEAEHYGYETSILERVRKPQTPGIRKKRRGTGSGYATSGQSSASESGWARTEIKEQGVDEILQMKMLESMLDYPPSTIVLATGDAAEAEFSGGFIKAVLRALQKGWKVELMTWKHSRGEAWLSDVFKVWEDRHRFRIVELDDYCEEMLAIYTKTFYYPVSISA